MVSTINRSRSSGALVTQPAVTGIWRNTPQPYDHAWVLPGAFGTTGLVRTVEDHAGVKPKLTLRNPVINDFVLTTTSRQHGGGSLVVGPHSQWGGFTMTTTGDWTALVEAKKPWSGPTDNPVSRLMSLALTRAYAKAKDTPVMAGEMLSEMDRTLRMLRRPFSHSVKLLTKMNQRRARSATRGATASSNAWLEYRYGWRPLISDMRELMTLATNQLRSLERFLVARASEEWKNESSFSFTDADLGVSLAGQGNVKATGSCTVVKTVRVGAGVCYIASSMLPTDALMKSLSLRGRDIPSLLWELTPYSFVVDWFANVGQWVQAVVPDPSLSFTGNWVTVIERTEVKYSSGTLKEQHTSPATSAVGSYGGSSMLWETVRRYPHQPLPTTPVLKGKALSIQQTADALSLSQLHIMKLLKGLRH